LKIHGPNQTNINPYKHQAHKLDKIKNEVEREDRIEISNQAKHLQQKNKATIKREKQVDEIKQAVQSGDYKINYEKTAKKMIDFWSGK